jgi:nitrogen fixation protein FixH
MATHRRGEIGGNPLHHAPATIEGRGPPGVASSGVDLEVALVALGQGRYGGEVQAHRGQWDLVLDLAQGGERRFRSKNRIVMK